jgi:hypothetical protein
VYSTAGGCASLFSVQCRDGRVWLQRERFYGGSESYRIADDEQQQRLRALCADLDGEVIL